LANDVTYVIATSPDLAVWTPAVVHHPGDSRSEISATLTADGFSKFARLEVSTNASEP
jgi:hypothetical protein